MTDVADAPAISAESAESAAEQLGERLFMEGVGSTHLFTVYLGLEHGLYRTLATLGPLTAAELAAEQTLDTWYVREWLQAEAIAGLVVADGDDFDQARFSLAPGVESVLVDETSPGYLGGLAYVLPAIGHAVPQLVDAFKTGAGVPYADYGPEAITAQGALNRPAFVNELVESWLPAMPDVLARLQDTASPARVADVGCGIGWAAIELAKAFPHVRVDGYDSDEASISAARRNAADSGVGDRVTFEVADASGAGFGDEEYDLVLFFECVHDMGRPVEALAAARRAVVDGGSVVVMDERVGEQPAIGDPVETFFATASVLWCLPQSRVVPDCEAPGTVMRPATFDALARRAGWTGTKDLDIEHPFWRFYRLIP